MTPKEFINKYYPFALAVEKKTKIPAVFIIAQAALESGWGSKSIGNNIFGIKYTPGRPFTVELTFEDHLITGEYKNHKGFISEEKIEGGFRSKIETEFAYFDTPEEAFKAHFKLLLKRKYIHALKWYYSPKKYAIAIWRAGYATALDYGKTMCNVIDSVNKRL